MPEKRSGAKFSIDFACCHHCLLSSAITKIDELSSVSILATMKQIIVMDSIYDNLNGVFKRRLPERSFQQGFIMVGGVGGLWRRDIRLDT